MTTPGQTLEPIEVQLAHLRTALRAEQRHAKMFAESVIPIGLALLRETDLGRLLEMILREAQRLACADGATLYMRRGDTLEFFLVSNLSLGIEMGGVDGKPITFPALELHGANGRQSLDSVACYTLHRRVSLNIPDIRQDRDFDFSGPRRFDDTNDYRTRSLLSVPLIGWDGEIVAVLQMINAQDEETGEQIPFSTRIQHVVESLAALAAGAFESFETKRHLYEQQAQHLRTLETTQARLREELTDAEKYIRAILPPPQETPMQIDWHLAPCSELGGDSFGYHEIDPDHWALYILDVCGHGLSAALLSVTAVTMIRSGGLSGADYRDPGAVLSVLNNAFLMRKQNNYYFTIWYGVYRLSTRELKYSSAGHAPAILIDPQSGLTTPLHMKGMILGARENKIYKTQTTTLPVGCTLYLLSDGTYEIKRREGDLWPFSEFLASLSALPHTEPGALGRWHQSIQSLRHPEPLEDDFSVVRIRA